jgi:hypothetical protein
MVCYHHYEDAAHNGIIDSEGDYPENGRPLCVRWESSRGPRILRTSIPFEILTQHTELVLFLQNSSFERGEEVFHYLGNSSFKCPLDLTLQPRYPHNPGSYHGISACTGWPPRQKFPILP